MEQIKDHLLVIDDSEAIQSLIKELFSTEFELTQYLKPVDALENVKSHKYDCIILDLMMPKMTGSEFLNNLRIFDMDTPVIILTAKDCSENEIAQLFRSGANDYVNKPFLTAELIARIKHHINLRKTKDSLIRANDELLKAVSKEEQLNEKIIDRTMALKRSLRKIKVLNRKLKYFATHDKLTGFLNRRAFFSFLENDIRRLKRTETKLSLIMLDLDFFKIINDTYGHLIGDYILVEFSKIVTSNLRDIDLVGRFGGEEFLILLTDCTVEDAVNVSNKLRCVIESAAFSKDGVDHKITVSIGVAEYRHNEKTDEFIKRVDEALYKAKNSGRNKVVASLNEDF